MTRSAAVRSANAGIPAAGFPVSRYVPNCAGVCSTMRGFPARPGPWAEPRPSSPWHDAQFRTKMGGCAGSASGSNINNVTRGKQPGPSATAVPSRARKEAVRCSRWNTTFNRVVRLRIVRILKMFSTSGQPYFMSIGISPFTCIPNPKGWGR